MTPSFECSRVAILVNIRVDTRERFNHFCASLNSCSHISAEWHINVRGDLRDEVNAFFNSVLGERAHFYDFLDESVGWMANAQCMLQYISCPYILLWNEDHMNLAPAQVFTELLADMEKFKVDYLPYSWWQEGRLRSIVDLVPPSQVQKGQACDVVHFDKSLWRMVVAKGYPYYLVSLIGIFRREFLERLLVLDQRKWPYSYSEWIYRTMTVLNRLGVPFHQRKMFARINRLLQYRLRRFPAYVPFDIEKAPYREDVLPLTIAFPRRELFACIDDDLDLPGSQLIKRGLYPPSDMLPASVDTTSSFSEKSKIIHEDLDYRIFCHKLLVGDRVENCYQDDSVRTPYIRFFTYGILQGSVMLAYPQSGRVTMHQAGAWISVPANLLHYLTAETASIILEVTSSRFEKDL